MHIMFPKTGHISGKPIQRVKIVYNIDATEDIFDGQIRDAFPLLHGVNYSLFRCNTHHYLEPLPPELMTPKDIKAWGEMGRSCIYIRPEKSYN